MKEYITMEEVNSELYSEITGLMGISAKLADQAEKKKAADEAFEKNLKDRRVVTPEPKPETLNDVIKKFASIKSAFKYEADQLASAVESKNEKHAAATAEKIVSDLVSYITAVNFVLTELGAKKPSNMVKAMKALDISGIKRMAAKGRTAKNLAAVVKKKVAKKVAKRGKK